MKMNKKGFTLIEMLVVIAIIAVLVSIVIPVVGQSTNKAACAANAANLRSALAAFQTLAIYDPDVVIPAAVDGEITIGTDVISVPASKACTVDDTAHASTPMTVTNTDGVITVSYGALTIEDFANEAG